jgi:hypothetical protein
MAHCWGVRVRYVDPKRPAVFIFFQCVFACDKMAGRSASDASKAYEEAGWVKVPTVVGGGGGMGALFGEKSRACEKSPRPPRWSTVKGQTAILCKLSSAIWV